MSKHGPTKSKRRAAPQKLVSLALQGGGAHGAFTWGVLDRLLEDKRLKIEGISGTSAGAVNAVAMAHGLVEGGPDGARQKLEDFWRAVARTGRGSPLQRMPFDILTGNWNIDHSPLYSMFDIFTRVSSPYDWNPLNLNPMRDLLEEQIDFSKVQTCRDKKLFVSATNVETGRVRVFDNREITADAVLASTCLPFIYQAVEIDGVPYWDGGYMGNPVLFPLFNHGVVCDVIVVQINPIVRKGTPRTAREILNRVNEITFNSSLLRELRAIDFVGRLLEEHRIDQSLYSRVLMHRIADDEALKPLGASSKMSAEWAFLEHLRDAGRSATERWLERHVDDLGQRPTINLRAFFQGAEGAEDAIAGEQIRP